MKINFFFNNNIDKKLIIWCDQWCMENGKIYYYLFVELFFLIVSFEIVHWLLKKKVLNEYIIKYIIIEMMEKFVSRFLIRSFSSSKLVVTFNYRWVIKERFYRKENSNIDQSLLQLVVELSWFHRNPKKKYVPWNSQASSQYNISNTIYSFVAIINSFSWTRSNFTKSIQKTVK